MKHFLGSVAIGAALAITAPAWAQSGAPTARGHYGVHHPAHHVVGHHRHRAMRGRDLANELNRQELSRIERMNRAGPAAPMHHPEKPMGR